jgi:hypothetical protein
MNTLLSEVVAINDLKDQITEKASEDMTTAEILEVIENATGVRAEDLAVTESAIRKATKLRDSKYHSGKHKVKNRPSIIELYTQLLGSFYGFRGLASPLLGPLGGPVTLLAEAPLALRTFGRSITAGAQLGSRAVALPFSGIRTAARGVSRLFDRNTDTYGTETFGKSPYAYGNTIRERSERQLGLTSFERGLFNFFNKSAYKAAWTKDILQLLKEAKRTDGDKKGRGILGFLGSVFGKIKDLVFSKTGLLAGLGLLSAGLHALDWKKVDKWIDKIFGEQGLFPNLRESLVKWKDNLFGERGLFSNLGLSFEGVAEMLGGKGSLILGLGAFTAALTSPGGAIAALTLFTAALLMKRKDLADEQVRVWDRARNMAHENYIEAADVYAKKRRGETLTEREENIFKTVEKEGGLEKKRQQLAEYETSSRKGETTSSLLSPSTYTDYWKDRWEEIGHSSSSIPASLVLPFGIPTNMLEFPEYANMPIGQSESKYKTKRQTAESRPESRYKTKQQAAENVWEEESPKRPVVKYPVDPNSSAGKTRSDEYVAQQSKLYDQDLVVKEEHEYENSMLEQSRIQSQKMEELINVLKEQASRVFGSPVGSFGPTGLLGLGTVTNELGRLNSTNRE